MNCFVDWLHQSGADLEDRPRLPEALYITKREADSLPEADPTNHFGFFKVNRSQMLMHSYSLLIKGTRCGANDLPWQQKTCSRIFVG